jgi:hypothetical protein
LLKNGAVLLQDWEAKISVMFESLQKELILWLVPFQIQVNRAIKPSQNFQICSYQEDERKFKIDAKQQPGSELEMNNCYQREENDIQQKIEKKPAC